MTPNGPVFDPRAALAKRRQAIAASFEEAKPTFGKRRPDHVERAYMRSLGYLAAMTFVAAGLLTYCVLTLSHIAGA